MRGRQCALPRRNLGQRHKGCPPVQHSLEGFLGAVCVAQGMGTFRVPGAGVKVLGQGQGLSWEASVTAVLMYSRPRNSL